MIRVTIQLHTGGDDHVEFPTRMPHVPREGDLIEAEDKYYEVESVIWALEEGEWTAHLWTKLANEDTN